MGCVGNVVRLTLWLAQAYNFAMRRLVLTLALAAAATFIFVTTAFGVAPEDVRIVAGHMAGKPVRVLPGKDRSHLSTAERRHLTRAFRRIKINEWIANVFLDFHDGSPYKSVLYSASEFGPRCLYYSGGFVLCFRDKGTIPRTRLAAKGYVRR